MPAGSTTLDGVTYLDHEPHEMPQAVPNRPRRQRRNMPSVAQYNAFNREAPPLSLDRQADDVDDYFSHFSCPICLLWRANGESRAVIVCGHVICVTCWDGWAHTQGRGPPNNRLTTCPVCRVEVNQSDTREVDFRATRFNSATAVSQRLTSRIAQLRQGNDELRAKFDSLRENFTRLEQQRDELFRIQREMAQLELGMERMLIED